jgi:prepilin-type N-terminal cleavage/methylation domain-containing protein
MISMSRRSTFAGGTPAPLAALSAPPAPPGFSLLEMMVAIALLSLGLVVLLQVQARSIQLAQQAREMTIATQLARAKLLDCQVDLLKKGFSIGDYDEEGDFSDDEMPGFYWECHAYKPEMPVADATDINTAAASGALGMDPSAGDDAAAAGGGQADPMMGMIAPIVAQMSGVLGDSIRELHVIIRWGVGEEMQEMTVTTHVIDKTAVNNIAAMIAQQAGALGALTGQPPVAPEGEDPRAPRVPKP